MSRFQPSMAGTAGSLLRAAGDLFGGVLSQAGNSAYEIRRADRGLCSSCAPQTEEEVAAAQAEAQVEQIHTKVRERDQTTGLDLDRQMVARCPKGGAQTAGGKFLPECGASLRPRDECGQCGAKMASAAKVCPECGAKRA
jgi:hypothetical protein